MILLFGERFYSTWNLANKAVSGFDGDLGVGVIVVGVYVPKGVGNFLKRRSFQVHKFLGRKSLEGLFVFCLPESCDMEKRNGKFSAGDVNSKEGRPAGSQDGLPTVQRIWCAKENFLPNSTVLFLLGQVVPSGDFAHLILGNFVSLVWRGLSMANSSKGTSSQDPWILGSLST